jgi:hypothetical protein
MAAENLNVYRDLSIHCNYTYLYITVYKRTLIKFEYEFKVIASSIIGGKARRKKTTGKTKT